MLKFKYHYLTETKWKEHVALGTLSLSLVTLCQCGIISAENSLSQAMFLTTDITQILKKKNIYRHAMYFEVFLRKSSASIKKRDTA